MIRNSGDQGQEPVTIASSWLLGGRCVFATDDESGDDEDRRREIEEYRSNHANTVSGGVRAITAQRCPVQFFQPSQVRVMIT